MVDLIRMACRNSISLVLLCTLAGCFVPVLPQSTEDKGGDAIQRRDYKKAEEVYRKALEQSPNSPEVLSDLGIALQMQGKSSEAIHSFEQALSIKHMPRTFALLAEEKCKIRDTEGAKPMLSRVLREDLEDEFILAVVAPCYLDLDEPLDSIRVYQKLLSFKAYPSDLAIIQLAKSYLRATQFFFGL